MLTAIDSKTPLHVLTDVIRSGITNCDTCGLCLSECPVNQAANCLHPRTIVRMARFGLIDDLIHLPEIWYCLSCKRCERECPMLVGPAGLIAAVRRDAYNSRVISPEIGWQLRSIYNQLHLVRRQVAETCFNDKPVPDLSTEWNRLAQAPPNGNSENPLTQQPLRMTSSLAARRASRAYLGLPTDVDCCFTCSECRNACPVSQGKAVFDPLWIIRMAAYGLFDEILRSPSIWLCIKCRSCAAACPQGVKGYLVIKRLQEMAIKLGFIDPAVQHRWSEMEKLVYMRFVREIDTLVGKPF